MVSRPIWDTVVRRKGTNSVTNAKRKIKQKLTLYQHLVQPGSTSNSDKEKAKHDCWGEVILRAALLQSLQQAQEMTHCICRVITEINREHGNSDTWHRSATSCAALLCYQEIWRSGVDTNPPFSSRCLTPGITEILRCAAPSYSTSWIEITQFSILFSVSSSFRGSGECSTS